MENTFAVIFVAAALVIIIIDLYFAAKSYQEKTNAGKYLGRAAVLAVLVTGSYLLSIFLTDYFAASLMASVYFVCIDWMLIMTLEFVIILSIREKPKNRPLMFVLQVCALLDSIVLMINPFREIAIHYVPIDSVIAHYQYEKHLLYNIHLGFTYLLVAAILGILIRRIVMTPQKYRNQLVLITASIMLIVAVNAVFIIPEKTSLYTLLDYSIIGYSVALLLMYWSAFSYSQTFLLEGLSKTIFDNVNQGIILFDYMSDLVMYNRRVPEIMPQVSLRRNMPMKEFLEQCMIPEEKIAEQTRYSMQSFSQKAELVLPVRCEYQKLLDDDGKINGHLFVFSDDSNEMDLLTGFHSWDHFRRQVQNDADMFHPPYAAAMFDINGLAEINRRLGKDIGDRRVHELAEMIREAMPTNACLVRGFDANLIAICRGMTEEELRPYAEEVVRASGGRVVMGLGAPATQYESILRVLRSASRSMSIRKLLDPESARSQALTSLVRALKESDSDTEAHVQRTASMGLELGRRLGLTDLQLSQLLLLCLLHDIGKIGIPLEILNKPGKLNREEWAVMQTHVEKGYQIAISSSELQDIAEMIRDHHERWDGKGYLHRMKGSEIPILSRIISVVDSYDAMVNDRVYRAALSVEAAKAEILRCSGSQFDPRIAEAFLQMLEEHPQIAEGKVTGSMTGSKGLPGASEEKKTFGASVLPETMKEFDLPKAMKEGDLAGAAEQGHETQAAEQEVAMADVSGVIAPAGRIQKEKPVRSYAVKYSRYLLDVDDRIVEIDDNFETMTGYSKDDVEERQLKQVDLIDEIDRLEYYMNVDQQMARGNLIYIEHDIIRKDGSAVHVYCSGRRYFDAASKSIRSEIIIVDAATTHHGKIKA